MGPVASAAQLPVSAKTGNVLPNREVGMAVAPVKQLNRQTSAPEVDSQTAEDWQLSRHCGLRSSPPASHEVTNDEGPWTAREA